MNTARKSRGNRAEIPREVKILTIAREFRGNGNLNPGINRKWISVPRSSFMYISYDLIGHANVKLPFAGFWFWFLLFGIKFILYNNLIRRCV